MLPSRLLGEAQGGWPGWETARPGSPLISSFRHLLPLALVFPPVDSPNLGHRAFFSLCLHIRSTPDRPVARSPSFSPVFAHSLPTHFHSPQDHTTLVHQPLHNTNAALTTPTTPTQYETIRSFSRYYEDSLLHLIILPVAIVAQAVYFSLSHLRAWYIHSLSIPRPRRHCETPALASRG